MTLIEYESKRKKKAANGAAPRKSPGFIRRDDPAADVDRVVPGAESRRLLKEVMTEMQLIREELQRAGRGEFVEPSAEGAPPVEAAPEPEPESEPPTEPEPETEPEAEELPE